MVNATPEVYWGEWHGTQGFIEGFICGRCGQGTVAPEVGDSLVDIIKLIRAHQRSEVCA
jgi:hypothetical protein